MQFEIVRNAKGNAPRLDVEFDGDPKFRFNHDASTWSYPMTELVGELFEFYESVPIRETDLPPRLAALRQKLSQKARL